jgi:hypothetical protein
MAKLMTLTMRPKYSYKKKSKHIIKLNFKPIQCSMMKLEKKFK